MLVVQVMLELTVMQGQQVMLVAGPVLADQATPVQQATQDQAVTQTLVLPVQAATQELRVTQEVLVVTYQIL